MKRFFVAFALVLVLLLCACGSDSNTDEATDNKDLFNDVFAELSEQIDKMTFDECLAYFDAASFAYDKTLPSEDDMGQITVNGDEGFKLTVFFYPNDKDEYTVTLLSYSNGDFEGSVSDNFHTSAVTYGIYDVTAETKNTDVPSLKDVMRFINEEVPEKMAEYAKANEGNTELEVILEPSYEISDGKVLFTVNTNLPDNTQLMLTLSDGAAYTAQTKITVKNGAAVSEGFSNKGEQLSGHYSLSVSMSLPKLQDESVIAVIGTKGEFLTGEFVEASALGDSNVVSGVFEFDF